MNETIAAVVLGGALASFGFMYRRRLDNLEILRKTLYQLLVLYRSVRALNAVKPSEFAKLIMDALQSVYPELEHDEDAAKYEAFYAQLAAQLLESLFSFDEDDLLRTYMQAVENVSSIAPILAYKLSGNVGLKRYLTTADSALNEMKPIIGEMLAGEEKKVVETSHEIVRSDVAQEIIRELRMDIIWLSLRCGVLPFFGVLWRVFRVPPTKELLKGDIQNELESLLARTSALTECNS